MRVLSVNLGERQRFEDGKPGGATGIFKEPVEGPVRVSELGVEGDAVCNQKHHGGPDQAVYVYGMPDYAWWAEALGRELAPGTFGENLTLSELESARLNIGDRLHVGSVVLEVTAPRIPCGTLARRMEDPAFVKQFRAGERPGAYCRVIQPGEVQAGDPVRREEYSGERVPLLELYRDWFRPKLSEAEMQRYLRVPVAVRVRDYLEQQLAGLA